ncbi:hypothetical protein E2C01_047099 [Portunus trituberculatus]|uniref:Uncharacterized protein n=1 Tax=Portunus trituberculatus TaxID=210409 RepID=A0A5B7FZI0_PORTR|nr:hypothetical protein [Portunus trituberculatus]
MQQSREVIEENINNIPKILIPQTHGFESSMDVAAAIEQHLNLPTKLQMKFLHSGQVLLSSPDQDTFSAIMEMEEICGIPIQLKTTSHGTSKGILLKYPLLMHLSILRRHSAVLTAERCTTHTGEPTRQVEITVQATSTWRDRSTQRPTSECDTEREFSALGQATTLPRDPDCPRERIATSCHQLCQMQEQEEKQLMLTKKDLKDLFLTFAQTLATMLGKDIQASTLDSMMETVIQKITHKQESPRSQQQNTTPVPNRLQQRKTTNTTPDSQHNEETDHPLETLPTLPPGTTPMTARIEQEKAALGITKKKMAPTKPKSTYCSGTSRASGTNTTS